MFKKIINSFDNKQDSGFSARKLTAFWLIVLISFLHYSYVNVDNCINALMIDSSMVLILLGLITAEQLIKLKNDNNIEPTKES